MTAYEIISLLTQIGSLLESQGIQAALILLAGSWLTGKGLILLFKNPFARRLLGYGLKSAGAPAVILGKWLQVGPLHMLSGPIVCLLVFFGFWFFTFMDRLLTYLKPDSRAMVEALEKMLGEIGSTDRKLYIQAKTMTGPQVTAVSQMAEAVAAGPAQLGAEQLAVLDRAQAIGSDLQQNRLDAAR